MPERATRHAELWAHYAASTHPTLTETPWPIEHPTLGPCAACRCWTVRYGPNGAPLCAGCNPDPEVRRG